MTRILTISLVILGVAAGGFYLMWQNTQDKLNAANDKISVLNKQIKGYENEISTYNEAQAKATDKIEKVRTIVKTVKTDCDCYNQPLPDDVKRLLRSRK